MIGPLVIFGLLGAALVAISRNSRRSAAPPSTPPNNARDDRFRPTDPDQGVARVAPSAFNDPAPPPDQNLRDLHIRVWLYVSGLERMFLSTDSLQGKAERFIDNTVALMRRQSPDAVPTRFGERRPRITLGRYEDGYIVDIQWQSTGLPQRFATVLDSTLRHDHDIGSRVRRVTVERGA